MNTNAKLNRFGEKLYDARGRMPEQKRLRLLRRFYRMQTSIDRRAYGPSSIKCGSIYCY